MSGGMLGRRRLWSSLWIPLIPGILCGLGCGADERDATERSTHAAAPAGSSSVLRSADLGSFEGGYRCNKGVLEILRTGRWLVRGSCEIQARPQLCPNLPGAFASTPVLEWTGTRWGPSSACLPTWTTAISGSSPDDIWISGDWNTPGQQGRTSVWHWDGATWTEVVRWTAKTELGPIWSSNIDRQQDGSVWVLGQEPFNRGAVRRLREGIWEDVTPTQLRKAWGAALDIDRAPASRAWLVGGASAPARPFVLRWNEGRWIETPFPGNDYVTSVQSFRGKEAWAVSGELLARWDGVEWRRVSTAAGGTMTALGPSEIWISGTRPMQWDGLSWKTRTAGLSEPFGLHVFFRDDEGTLIGLSGFPGCSFTRAHTHAYRWSGRRWELTSRGIGEALHGMQVPLTRSWSLAPGGAIWLIGNREDMPGC